MKLYHSHASRSARVRWLLEELELPYHLEHVEIFQPERTPEHLRVHPHGKVPAIVDGEHSMIESAAMLMQYADLHAERSLAPKVGTPERGRYYELIVYAVATMDPIVSGLFAQLVRTPEPDRDERAIAFEKKRLGEALPYLARQLGDSTWLLGDQFSAADIAVGWDLALAGFLQLLDEPKLKAYLERLSGRPAFQRAYAD